MPLNRSGTESIRLLSEPIVPTVSSQIIHGGVRWQCQLAGRSPSTAGRSLAPGETMACPWCGVLGRPLALGRAETGHGQGLLQVSEFWQLAEVWFKERNESVLMEGSGCTARAGGAAGGSRAATTLTVETARCDGTACSGWALLPLEAGA